ncbi:hypothetical protein EV182_003294, partial [Spiromyces aspiralis]
MPTLQSRPPTCIAILCPNCHTFVEFGLIPKTSSSAISLVQIQCFNCKAVFPMDLKDVPFWGQQPRRPSDFDHANLYTASAAAAAVTASAGSGDNNGNWDPQSRSVPFAKDPNSLSTSPPTNGGEDAKNNTSSSNNNGNNNTSSGVGKGRKKGT